MWAVTVHKLIVDFFWCSYNVQRWIKMYVDFYSNFKTTEHK